MKNTLPTPLFNFSHPTIPRKRFRGFCPGKMGLKTPRHMRQVYHCPQKGRKGGRNSRWTAGSGCLSCISADCQRVSTHGASPGWLIVPLATDRSRHKRDTAEANYQNGQPNTQPCHDLKVPSTAVIHRQNLRSDRLEHSHGALWVQPGKQDGMLQGHHAVVLPASSSSTTVWSGRRPHSPLFICPRGSAIRHGRSSLAGHHAKASRSASASPTRAPAYTILTI